VRQFTRATNGILPGSDSELDNANIESDLEMKKQAEERELHQMAKVHDFLEMWQGSQNQRATQKESRAQNMKMTAMGYISTPRRLSKHPGHSFNMMVWLHSNRQKDLLCHHLYLQRTSVEDELPS